MENIEKELTRDRKIVHEERKILRTKPLILVQKYAILFLILIAFAVTTILGMYNVSNVRFLNEENKYVRESDIKDLLEENVITGTNFFLINPDKVEEVILQNTYVKSVKVEKVFPNKLNIDIEEYKPFIVFQTSDSKCKIFSKEGVLLETNEEVECDELASLEKSIYFTGDENQIVNENGKETFYLSDNIYDLSKILKNFGMSISSVSMESSVISVYAGSTDIILDTNQDILTEFSRLYLVLEELEKLEKKAVSIDVRFDRPVIVIDN